MFGFENQLKTFAKAKIPTVKGDLCEMIESLLLQVADDKEANPFELVLMLSKKDEMAIGRVCDQEQNLLSEMDAGQLMKDLFLMQLKGLPDMLKDMVESEIGDEDISNMVLDVLKDKSFLTYYNEEQELIFFQINQEGSTQIDLDELLNNLEF